MGGRLLRKLLSTPSSFFINIFVSFSGGIFCVPCVLGLWAPLVCFMFVADNDKFSTIDENKMFYIMTNLLNIYFKWTLFLVVKYHKLIFLTITKYYINWNNYHDLLCLALLLMKSLVKAHLVWHLFVSWVKGLKLLCKSRKVLGWFLSNGFAFECFIIFRGC